MEAKTELRRAIKERLGRLAENDRRVESQIIVRELRKLIPKDARIVAAYSPYLDEPDIAPLVTELLEQKNVICMGKVEGNRMVMHRIRSLADVRRNPVTNILEPRESAPVDESAVDIAIVPGRAFTENGERLGRGNGGYDRWISDQRKRQPETLMIGVCFGCQILQAIPMEPHDESVDVVLTATKLFRRK